MKKAKIIFWITTGFIFLFEGVMPALTGSSEMAKEGIRHLGYPDYFRTMLNVFKVSGALALLIPQVPKRIKELAYAGFTFDFICAAISIWAVDGFSFMVLFPLIVLAVLLVSQHYYYKLFVKQNRPVVTDVLQTHDAPGNRRVIQDVVHGKETAGKII